MTRITKLSIGMLCFEFILMVVMLQNGQRCEVTVVHFKFIFKKNSVLPLLMVRNSISVKKIEMLILLFTRFRVNNLCINI